MNNWGKFVYELEYYNELQALQEIEDKGYEPKWSLYVGCGSQFVVFAKKKEA